MIGVKGTKKEAIEIKELVKEFLKSIGLKLNEEKTRIININEHKATFLGTGISRAKCSKFVRTRTIKRFDDQSLGIKRLATKRNPRRLRMEAPLQKVKSKLTEAGFIKEGKSYPKFV